LKAWLDNSREGLEETMAALKQQAELDINPKGQADKALKINDTMEILQFYMIPSA